MFSTAVKLTDIDDYITPAQQCIKPLLTAKPSAPTFTSTSTTTSSSIQLTLDYEDIGIAQNKKSNLNANTSGGHFNQIKLDATKKTATITLSDCLSCSGCVTSAETVLMKQQSIEECMQQINSGTKKLVVVSIAPQSCAALAQHYQCSELSIFRRLRTFFTTHLGISSLLLIDLSIIQAMSIMEAQFEFVTRYLHHHPHIQPKHLQDYFRPSPSSSSSDLHTSLPTAASDPSSPAIALPLPILSSECPGWICYAEKTQTSSLLPHLSTVKSSQAMMGTIVKNYISKAQGLDAGEVYHVCVAPCYDKKLEAARSEFTDPSTHTRDVDVVLSSQEILELVREKGVDLREMREEISERDVLYTSPSSSSSLLRTLDPTPTGSGAYAESIFRFAAKIIWDIEYGEGELPWVMGRNKDWRELTLKIDNQPVLTFLLCYGFRNIQNLMRKMKSNPSAAVAFHYVEIMSCPSG